MPTWPPPPTTVRSAAPTGAGVVAAGLTPAKFTRNYSEVRACDRAPARWTNDSPGLWNIQSRDRGRGMWVATRNRSRRDAPFFLSALLRESGMHASKLRVSLQELASRQGKV